MLMVSKTAEKNASTGGGIGGGPNGFQGDFGLAPNTCRMKTGKDGVYPYFTPLFHSRLRSEQVADSLFRCDCNESVKGWKRHGRADHPSLFTEIHRE